MPVVSGGPETGPGKLGRHGQKPGPAVRLKGLKTEEPLVVLVVGGAGYIGSHAARTLRRRGDEVVIYDKLSTGHEVFGSGFELVRGDNSDAATLSGALRRVDSVMHFAAHAYVGESVTNPRKYFRNNVEGGLVLLNACVDCGVRRIIFSSTCAVYGVPARVPIPENIPRQPVNPYGVSKLFFEDALEAYDRAYGLRFAALRYFNAARADERGEDGPVHEPGSPVIPSAPLAATRRRPQPESSGTRYHPPHR